MMRAKHATIPALEMRQHEKKPCASHVRHAGLRDYIVGSGSGWRRGGAGGATGSGIG